MSRYSSKPSSDRAGSDRVSSAPSRTYNELSAILEKYVSPLLVHSTLRNALEHNGLTPATLNRKSASAVVENAMIGMRLFCDGARLQDLMLDLAEYCAGSSH